MLKPHKAVFAFFLFASCTCYVFSQAVLSPEMQARIKARTPVSLPQKPVAKRETTDARVERVKGKVKTVTEEINYLTGYNANSGRRISGIDEYDQKGNLLRSIYLTVRPIRSTFTAISKARG